MKSNNNENQQKHRDTSGFGGGVYEENISSIEETGFEYQQAEYEENFSLKNSKLVDFTKFNMFIESLLSSTGEEE